MSRQFPHSFSSGPAIRAQCIESSIPTCFRISVNTQAFLGKYKMPTHFPNLSALQNSQSCADKGLCIRLHAITAETAVDPTRLCQESRAGAQSCRIALATFQDVSRKSVSAHCAQWYRVETPPSVSISFGAPPFAPALRAVGSSASAYEQTIQDWHMGLI